MFNVRLAGGHLYGERLFTLAVAGDVFDGVFFVLSFFPLDVLDEIWDLIESVSEGFLTYSSTPTDKATIGSESNCALNYATVITYILLKQI